MHPEDEDLELYYLLRFSPHQITAIESHVSECEFCRGRIRVFAQSRHGKRNQAADRIRDRRIALTAASSIRVLESATALTGQILDISGNEMKLKLSDSLHPGVFVQTRIGTRIITGQVRYCDNNGQEFHAGVEIESIFVVTSKGEPRDDPRSMDS